MDLVTKKDVIERFGNAENAARVAKKHGFNITGATLRTWDEMPSEWRLTYSYIIRKEAQADLLMTGIAEVLE